MRAKKRKRAISEKNMFLENTPESDRKETGKNTRQLANTEDV